MLRKILSAISFSIVLGILASGICFGQIKSGTVTGRVTDSSGAVIPAANVSVVNQGTKVPTETKTGDTGDYTVPFLEPGTYDVTVTKDGFTTFQQTGIVLGVDTTARIDAQLAVGRTATVVEVKSAGAAALQTETATLGDTVASQAIDALPNINHNPFYFATLQPGVTGRWELMDNSSPMSFGIGIYSHDDYSAFSVNGATAFSASITVDGVNIQGASWNESDIEPAPESIQEVKTYTNSYDASIGRGQGAVAIVSKSGTDNYHGVVFGRLRNEALNANSFANDVQGDSQAAYGNKPIPKQAFKVLYYGAAMGGPIKKDKAFFFASWQGMAHNATRQDLLNVPVNNQAAGDFSSPEGCLNPFSTSSITGTPSNNNLGTCVNVNGTATPLQLFNPFQISSVSNGIYTHTPITGPNGVSDMSQIGDPSAIGPNGLFSYYPKANRFPTDQYDDNNYFFQGPSTFRSQTISSRVDINTGKHSLYFAGGIEWGSIHTATPWNAKPSPEFYVYPVGNSQITQLVYSHAPYGSVGDTIALSPTLIIDARFGVQRTHDINMNPVVKGVDYSNFGMPASIQAILPQPGAAPDFGTSPVGQWSALQNQSTGHKNEHQTNYHGAISATKVKGNWTLKWGGEYLGDLTNTPNPYYTGGYIGPDGCGGCQNTNSSYASVNNLTAATGGLANVGDIAMGAAYWQILSAQVLYPALEEQYLGVYSANTWKITPRLTLNLGVRWDFQPGPSERHNMEVSFVPSATSNPISSSPNTVGGFGGQGAFYYAGINGDSRHLWNSEYSDWGPRVGLAYRLGNSTVIRGGYGISYLPTNTGLLFGPYYYYESSWGLGSTTKLFGNTTPAGAPVYSMENPAVSPLVIPVGANPSAPQDYGYGSNLYPRNYGNGYMQQYNLFVERKMGNWLVSAGYSGSLGARLPLTLNLNGENTTMFNAPTPDISCFHAGLNCSAFDSSTVTSPGQTGGYLGTGSDPYTQQVQNPFNPNGTLPFQGAYSGTTISRGLHDGPFPLFNGIQTPVDRGYSRYDSLQMEAKHQFAKGLMLDVFYTWSKALEASYFNSEHNQSADTESGSLAWDQINLRNNRRYGLDDVPGRFVANLVYNLPFGAGHSMNPSNKVASYLTSGWSLGATEMDQSGYPLNIYDDDAGALNGKPDRVASEPLLVPKSLQHWYNGSTPVTLPDGRIIKPCNYCFLKYNPDAFIGHFIANPNLAKAASTPYINDTYWMGQSAINYSTVRDPSINNLNFTIKREFKVTERVNVELVANATNALNHPNIKTYSADPGGMQLSPTANAPSNTQLGQGGNTSGYGTHGLTDFDNRQIEFQLRVRF